MGAGAVLEGGRFVTNLDTRAVALFLVAGLTGTTMGRILVYAGVKRVGASVSTAGINTRPLFVLLLGGGILGETITPRMLFGICLIVIGVAVLSLSKGGDVSGWRAWDLIYLLLASVALGVGNVLRRYGLTTTGATPLEALALNEIGGLLRLSVFVGAHTGDFRRLDRIVYVQFMTAGVLTTTGLVALFVALNVGAVTVVDPLVTTAPLFTTVFAFLLLRGVERVSPGVVLGALGIVVGAGIVTSV